MPESIDIAALNQQLTDDGASWRAAANPISNLDRDAQDRLLGVDPGPFEASLHEVDQQIKAAPEVTSAMAIQESNAGAPAQFDNRNHNGKDYTTPVKNQGGCGSCVAFGTVAVMETTYQRGAGGPNSGIDLSEAHMFYCHGGSEGRNCSNGWFPEPAFQKAKELGVATEDKYPYTGSQQACAVAAGWQDSKATSTGHTKLNSRAEMKNWIATRGSITGCFIVYSDFFAYRNGVYRRTSDEQRGGHCVEIIGYDDAQAAWICKNSWGTGWGDNGYFKIGYGQCGIETWAGPFGVNSVSLRSWFKGVKVTGLYTTEQENNTWAYLSGRGWTLLTSATPQSQHAMLAELVGARTRNQPVSALVDNNRIDTLYAQA